MTVSVQHPRSSAIDAIVSRESDLRMIRQLRKTSGGLGGEANAIQFVPLLVRELDAPTHDEPPGGSAAGKAGIIVGGV